MLHAAGNGPAKALTEATLGRLGLPFEAIYSTFGRILARGIESKLLVDRMAGWHERLMANIERGEVLRTIHSFDPCMACAAHVFGPTREEIVKVKIR